MIDDAQHGEGEALRIDHEGQVQRPGVAHREEAGRTPAHCATAFGDLERMRLDVLGRPAAADRQVFAMLAIEPGLDLAAAAAVRGKVDHLLAGPLGFAAPVGFANVARWM